MSDNPPSATTEMPLPPELTLIVAATRSMGIGLNGTLPWTGLKKEMAYFARVTKRLPQQPTPTTTTTTTTPATMNAVIMGRKTWDSIPTRFRPLKGRLNIVVSRSHAQDVEEGEGEREGVAVAATQQPGEGPVRVASLEQALTQLQTARVGRAFVIGGAQIYGAALELPAARRVLLTRVWEPAFECDTFFPAALKEEEKDEGCWVRRSKGELDAWTGETVPEGVQEESGTRYEFEMWEREA
ncbi:hypothetical protein M426DRAFT_317010 [Hypoxylon sp. CI-4A]|nr:hypothetical protein M426DRAFT_317010 [Hypoxylon sp. CI-4A]